MLSPEKSTSEDLTAVAGNDALEEPREDDLRVIAEALHDLCQPLTALQCRLEIGQLMGTPAGFQEAVAEGLRECSRLLQGVNEMRNLVRNAMERR